MIFFYRSLPIKQEQLSALRMELATRLGLRIPTEFAPLWVVDFPLLEFDEESGRYHAMHHPFTSLNQKTCIY
jgi:aspartyl-tRNA synthetase